MDKRLNYIFLVVAVVVVVLLFVFIKPHSTAMVSFNLPNDLETTNNHAELNLEFTNVSSMKDFVWNWQGKNHTLFGNSLVLMYNFDEVSSLGETSSHVFDVSGNGNNGTISGAVYTTGKYNKGLYFNGTNYVDAGTDSSLDITGDVTISAWFKADDDARLGGVRDFVKINDTSLGGVLNDSDNFGNSIENLWDLDDNGITDLAVGAFNDDDGKTDAGAVYILFMNSNGTVKNWVKINDTNLNGTLNDGDYFGKSLTGRGDFNLDSTRDLAIGSDKDDDGGVDIGAVYILFMNSNGTVKNWTKINDSSLKNSLIIGHFFGVALTNLGDLDNDGIQDLAVGDIKNDGGVDIGAVYILFMNSNGTVKNWTKINNTNLNGFLEDGDYFGQSMTNLGDLDNDGIMELAVTSLYDDDGGANRGAVYILYMNTNGSIKYYTKINDTSLGGILKDKDLFGSSVTDLGDFDGDGIQDLAVGARKDDDGATDAGAVYLLFMNPNGTVKDFVKINNTNLRGALKNNDRFGSSLSMMEDFNNDGIQDLAVGANKDDDGKTNAGAVYILSVEDGPGKIVCKNSSYELGVAQGQIKANINHKPIYKNGNYGSDWNHIVLVSDGSQKKIYLNGQLISTTDSGIIQQNGNHLYIGKNFNGTIDELRIWNRTLSEAEITQLYKSNLNKKSPNAWGFYIKQSGLALGSYPYYVYLKDKDGMMRSPKRNILIKAIAQNTPVVSSGILKFFPSLEKLREGYRQYLFANQEIHMQVRGEQHSVKVIKIYKDKITIVISSEPRTLNLTVNETKQVDVDGDNSPDLEFSLKRIVGNKADLIIKSLAKTTMSSSFPKENSNQTAEKSKPVSKEFVLKTIEIIEGILILGVLGILAWLFIKRKEEMNKSSGKE